MKTNKKRNLKKAGFVAGVLCLASIGGVSAYLTDFDMEKIEPPPLKMLIRAFPLGNDLKAFLLL